MRVKTDRLDARTLATKAAAGQLKAVAIPPRTQHEQRQVLRTYGQAVRARKRAQIQLRSLFQEHGRLGPPPHSGWRVYERWLATQALPEPVAIKVFDLAVNLGDQTAVICLQRALRACNLKVKTDGLLGPETCGAAERADAAALMAAFRSEAAGEYRLRVARDAGQAAFRDGWLNRAYA